MWGLFGDGQRPDDTTSSGRGRLFSVPSDAGPESISDSPKQSSSSLENLGCLVDSLNENGHRSQLYGGLGFPGARAPASMPFYSAPSTASRENLTCCPAATSCGNLGNAAGAAPARMGAGYGGHGMGRP